MPLINPDPAISPKLHHGVTLENIMTRLVEKYGWCELSHQVNMNGFNNRLNIASSLKYLKKTPEARQKIITLYLKSKWPLK